MGAPLPPSLLGCLRPEARRFDIGAQCLVPRAGLPRRGVRGLLPVSPRSPRYAWSRHADVEAPPIPSGRSARISRARRRWSAAPNSRSRQACRRTADTRSSRVLSRRPLRELTADLPWSGALRPGRGAPPRRPTPVRPPQTEPGQGRTPCARSRQTGGCPTRTR